MASEHVKKKKFAKQRWEDLSTCWSVFNETIIPLRRVGCEMIMANLALQAWLAIYHLISNESLWNNCLIYLPFSWLFVLHLSLEPDMVKECILEGNTTV